MVPVQDADKPEATRREYPQRPIASAAAWVFQGDRVLLIRRGQAPDKGRWSVPGGAIELGEAHRDAVQRELREECDIEIDIIRVIDVVDIIIRDEVGGYSVSLRCDLPAGVSPERGSEAWFGCCGGSLGRA